MRKPRYRWQTDLARSHSDPKPFLDTFLGRVVSAVTIVGAIVGPWWTYSRYMEEDAPGLLLRPKMQGELSWYRRARSNDECIAVFKITLENIGKRPIELTSATVRVWPLDIQPQKDIDYVDPLDRTNGIDPSREADLMPPSEPSGDGGDLLTPPPRKAFLRTYYPPGVADEIGMMFRLKRDPGKIVVFLAEGEYKVEGTKKQDGWYWHAWDEVCGLEDLSKKADKDDSAAAGSLPAAPPRPPALPNDR